MCDEEYLSLPTFKRTTIELNKTSTDPRTIQRTMLRAFFLLLVVVTATLGNNVVVTYFAFSATCGGSSITYTGASGYCPMIDSTFSMSFGCEGGNYTVNVYNNSTCQETNLQRTLTGTLTSNPCINPNLGNPPSLLISCNHGGRMSSWYHILLNFFPHLLSF